VIVFLVSSIPTFIIVYHIMAGKRRAAIEDMGAVTLAKTNWQLRTKIYVRWEIPEQYLEFAVENKKFDKVEASKKWVMKNFTYIQVDYPGIYWAYSWEIGDLQYVTGKEVTLNQLVGQTKRSKFPMILQGKIMKILTENEWKRIQ